MVLVRLRWCARVLSAATRAASSGAGAGGAAPATASAPAAAMDELRDNPYYDKYAERIAQRQRAAAAAPAPAAPAPTVPATPDTRQYSSVLNPKRAAAGTGNGPGAGAAPEDKKLEAIFRMELVQDKDAAEIRAIWEEYHLRKEVICATVPAEQYLAQRERMRAHPAFVLPLPRAAGYEFVLCQSSGHEVHFTPLLAYQVHHENAPECLTVVNYTELQHKGIVLMRGHYDKNVLSGQEAQCLANQFQMYYSGRDPAKEQLLRAFTASPAAFDHMDLIAQMENITLL